MSQSSLYFIFGDEPVLVEEKVNALIQSAPEANVQKFKEQFELSQFEQCLQSSGLFFSQNLIVIQSPWFISKSPDKKQLTHLERLLNTAKDSDHIVIIYHLGAVDQRKKVPGILKKVAQTFEFKAYKDWEQDKLYQWIRQTCEAKGKSIEQDAIIAFEQLAAMNLRVLSSYIETLVIYLGDRTEITIQDIHAISGGTTSTYYQLTEALKKGKKTDVLVSIKELLKQGEDSIKILGMLSASFRLYLQVALCTNQRMSVAEMGKKLGKNPYFLKRIVADIKGVYSMTRFKQAMSVLSQCDVDIKSGKKGPESALLLGVSRIFS